MISTLYIDNVKIDQFKDENITVVSSVLDIKDITKNTTDFSRGFTVPASINNNKTFLHYYNANIDNGFDARTKIDGEIHLDGQVFKVGKWRLHKVNVKKGRPESYTINFNGRLNTIKDLAGSLELKDAFTGVTTFDHDYDSDNVKTGLTGSLFSGSVIYNLFAKKQYYYNDNPIDNINTDSLANIAWGGGAAAGVKWNDLKPSLKVLDILEAIETLLGITFTRDFFGTTEFNGLFMWMNPNKDKEIIGNSHKIDWDGGVSTWMNLTTNIGSYPIDGPNGIKFYNFIKIYPDTASMTIPYTIRYYEDDELAYEIPWTGTYDTDLFFPLVSPEAVTIEAYWEIVAEQEFTYSAELIQLYFSGSGGVPYTTTASTNTLESKMIISENIPKMKIIDFLKGIFQMYKLVIIPTSDTEYYVNTLQGYYAEGVTYDITKYVHFDNWDAIKGEILNEISFKFKEPQTILNIQFEQNTGTAYGDEETRLYTDATETELLDGGSLTVKLPFEQIIYERLVDLNDNDLTNIIYGAIVDEEISPVNPEAHLFYNALMGQIGKHVAFITDTGVKEEISVGMNVPIHGNSLSFPVFSTVFGEEFNEWDNNVITNTLYSNHYQEYIEAIFNVKKRTFKYKAQLPLRIINKLELNDVLYINGNYYRIDKWSYNLLTGETDFELVNSFDNVVNAYKSSSENIWTDQRAKTEEYFISNLSGADSTFAKTDYGDGTGWVTVATYETEATAENILTLIFDENETEEGRSMLLTATQDVTGVEIDIFITQGELKFYPAMDFSDERNSMNVALLALRT